MPISNEEAYRLRERRGLSVPVVCGDCGDLVWSMHATYRENETDWVCGDCEV